MAVPVDQGLGQGLDEFASPACSMPPFTVKEAGSSLDAAGLPRAEVLRWRKGERERLIALRLAIDPARRTTYSRRIADTLDGLLPDLSGGFVSLYWPFRGEPDLRDWSRSVNERGGRCALPVVVAKGAALVFREWRMGDPLERGVWNIPVPVAGPTVRPDVTLAPVVGFDKEGYRLGYGGGFFDRTLAALAPRPKVIGVGYGIQALPTIHPLPHDIGMDALVTEDGLVWSRP